MLTVISLYTGAGGLDYGFEAAGFRTAVAVEMDAACCRFLEANRKHWPTIGEDIGAVGSEEILQAAKLDVGQADVLIGGPPCQPFSKSGYWAAGDARRMDDPRADTLTHYLRVLRDARPRVFLLENVHGLLFKNKDEGYRHFMAGIREVNRQAGTNYQVSTKVLNAAHFGVPQLRERAFLVASRDGRDFDFPPPRFSDPGESEQADWAQEPFITAWDALADLPAPPSDDPALEVAGKWGALLPTIPEGHNYLWHTERGGGVPLFGWRRRYWGFLLKLAKNKPSWTIQAQPGTSTGPFHWKSRRLTAHEMACIQTFPDGLRFDCTHRGAQRLLGNAVPSLLAEILAQSIRSQLLDAPAKDRPTLLPSRKGPPPAPETLAPLPRQYERLIGDHEDHPGERRGPRGRLRQATVGN